MTVTFTLTDGIGGCACSKAYAAGCGCDEHKIMMYCDHIHEIAETCECNELQVNVSNTSAITILGRLGFDHPDDYLGGSCNAEDFVGRTKLANVDLSDTGVRSTVDAVPGRVMMVDAGIRPGYYEDVMTRLEEVGLRAVAAGSEIQWC